MKGRLEHSFQIEKNIKEILSTLPQYVTEYYYEFKAGRQPTACREYIRKIAKFLYFINSQNVKEIEADQISKFDITRFLDSIEYITDNNGNQKQSSLSYKKCYHSVLKSFFDFLLENDYIIENPMNKIKRVRGEDFVNRKFLDEDDLKEILLAVECGAGNRRSVAMQYKWKSRDRAIMMLFMQTGIRETALSEINIEDIDFENHIIKSVIEKGHKDKTFTMSSQLEKAQGVFELSHGSADTSIIKMRELAIFLLLSGANKFIVVHNHPNGSKDVSVNDINITRKIQEMANFIEVDFLQHFTIGNDGYDTCIDNEENDEDYIPFN